MIYSPDDIKHALGAKYNEEHDYILARRADIIPKGRAGWTEVGTLPDFGGQDGTMTIMARPRVAPK